VSSGVPQGSVLEPILFVCYINDLPQEITSFLYMYAEDTKLFRESSTDVNRAELQKDLEVLNERTEKWQLRFKVEKCKVMYFGGLRNLKTVYRMEQSNNNMTTLQETVVEKDLGV
jgi:Reverse transcriptase (RNA-dependent DNA polymerase)